MHVWPGGGLSKKLLLAKNRGEWGEPDAGQKSKGRTTKEIGKGSLTFPRAVRSCRNILRERGPGVGETRREAESAQDSRFHRRTRGNKDSPVGGRLWTGTATRPGWFSPEIVPRTSPQSVGVPATGLPEGRMWPSLPSAQRPGPGETVCCQPGQDQARRDQVAALEKPCSRHRSASPLVWCR